MIGYFGNIIFEVNDKRVLTFSDFNRSQSARYAKHNILGKKSSHEFLGPENSAITFNIKLNSNLGINVENEYNKWTNYLNNGIANELIIGGKIIGDDKWIVKSLSDTWNIVTNKGVVTSCDLSVSIEEYIEEL